MKTQFIAVAIAACLLALTTITSALDNSTEAADNATVVDNSDNTTQVAVASSEPVAENTVTEASIGEPAPESQTSANSEPQAESSMPDMAMSSTTSAVGQADPTPMSEMGGGNSNETMPIKCYKCDDCAVQPNDTWCMSSTGICSMTFNVVTNKATRGCDVNVTTCDSPHPWGKTANGQDCGYCCKGSECNNHTLTKQQCDDNIKNDQDDNHADDIRMSMYVTFGLMAFGVLARFLLLDQM